MGHHLIKYVHTDQRRDRAECMNPKHTRCRGVEWRRVGFKWYHPRHPRVLFELEHYGRELGGIMRDMLASFRPWLLVAALGIAYGFAIAAVLLSVFLI